MIIQVKYVQFFVVVVHRENDRHRRSVSLRGNSVNMIVMVEKKDNTKYEYDGNDEMNVKEREGKGGPRISEPR